MPKAEELRNELLTKHRDELGYMIFYKSEYSGEQWDWLCGWGGQDPETTENLKVYVLDTVECDEDGEDLE